MNYDTIDWGAGKISGTTFCNDEEISKVCSFVYQKCMLMNPLHPDIFTALRKMEAEIIQVRPTFNENASLNVFKMTLDMYNTPNTGCGVLTSGGSESLGLAVLAARNRAFEKGIKWPEVVMCKSAHSGFDKACHYFRF